MAFVVFVQFFNNFAEILLFLFDVHGVAFEVVVLLALENSVQFFIQAIDHVLQLCLLVSNTLVFLLLLLPELTLTEKPAAVVTLQ